MARVNDEVCQRPRRSRKADLLSDFSLAIPAFIALLLRLYSRWYTVAKYELDDYIMMLVLVGCKDQRLGKYTDGLTSYVGALHPV